MKEKELTDESRITFGKYKGVALANVPDSYLRWFYEINIAKKNFGFNLLLMNYIEDNKSSIYK